MINAMNLFWIVPLAGAIGFWAAALFETGKDESKGEEEL